jgi:hypothetical protein
MDGKDRLNPKKPENRADGPKKKYEKPAFRHERVFETMALSCGKINKIAGQCRFNPRSS